MKKFGAYRSPFTTFASYKFLTHTIMYQEERTGNCGRIEVICGSMFSGKTEELIRRLKRARFAKQHPLTGFDDAMGNMGQVAATHTDGVNLGNIFGNGHQRGHGTEGYALKVHVKPRHNDALAALGQLLAYFGQCIVKKLRLVNAHDLCLGGKEQQAAC